MTSKREDNLKVLQDYFDAAAAGGPPATMPFYAENVVLDVPGAHPASGHYEGHEGVGRFGATMARLSGGTFRLSPIDLLASDDHVITYARVSVEVGGNQQEWKRVIVSTVEDGKLSTLRFYESDQHAVDAILNSAESR